MMNKIEQLKIYYFLILSLIPFLIWGPFFPDLIVSLSSLIFLYYVIKNKEFRFFKNKPLIIFFIFCIYCIFCSLLSQNILFSLKGSLFYFRIGIFACLIWYIIDKNKIFLKYFYHTLSICFLVLIFDSFFQYIFQNNIIGLPIIGNRISSFFGDELIMGSYLSRLLPLFCALHLIKEKKKYDNYFIFSIFLLSGLVIFLSGERVAFFFYILTITAMLVLIKRYQKIIILLIFLISICLGIIIANNPWIKERMIDQFIVILPLEGKAKKYVISQQHDTLFKTAFNMFKDKPIFGHGPRMYRILSLDKKYFIDESSPQMHPHNFYFQLLAETGIIGFSFLFSFFCYVSYCFYRQIKSIFFERKKYLSDYQICLLIGILLTLWPFSPNGNFFTNWIIIVYSLPMGFYLHSIFGYNKL